MIGGLCLGGSLELSTSGVEKITRPLTRRNYPKINLNVRATGDSKQPAEPHALKGGDR